MSQIRIPKRDGIVVTDVVPVLADATEVHETARTCVVFGSVDVGVATGVDYLIYGFMYQASNPPALILLQTFTNLELIAEDGKFRFVIDEPGCDLVGIAVQRQVAVGAIVSDDIFISYR